MAEDGTLLLVAEENSKIAGFLFGFLSPSPVLKRPAALLDALFVCEEHRSKGIGKALALRLYESLGFSETKKVYAVYFISKNAMTAGHGVFVSMISSSVSPVVSTFWVLSPSYRGR